MDKHKIQKIISSFVAVILIISFVFAPFEHVFAADTQAYSSSSSGSKYKPLQSFQKLKEKYVPKKIRDAESKVKSAIKQEVKDKAKGAESYLSELASYQLNISNITEAIPAVIGCTGIVNKVEKKLTSMLSPSSKGQGNVFGTGASKPTEVEGQVPGQEFFGDGMQVVSVGETHASSIKDNTAKNAELEAQAKLREECINGIAFSLAKKHLNKITDITVNWINSGFNGDPLYVRDRESFFRSIAENNLNSVVGSISDVNNRLIYPFGREVARNIINAQKSTYESRARSTLQNSLRDGATVDDFANDFGAGGWDGWFSMTQNDQNNPLGFSIMTAQELANKINKETEDAKSELQEGKGFLSQKRCVEKAGDSKSKEDPRFKKGSLGNTKEGDMEKCLRWETVTPGSIIAEKASTALTSDIRQLELARSLNESLSRVMSALMNQMVHKGLSSLTSFSEKFDTTLGGTGSNKVFDSLGNDITGFGSEYMKGTVLSVNKGRGWYSTDGDFDITTDLGDIKKLGSDGKLYVYRQGIISTQKDYIDAVKNSLATIPGIMPILGELDYCIPGPNAVWEYNAKEVINRIIEYLQGLYFDGGNIISPEESIWSQIANQAIKVDSGLGGQLGNTANTIGWVYDVVSVAFGKKSRAQKQADEEEQAVKRLQAEEEAFEKSRASQIQQAQDGYYYYKNLIDPLYGPESPMRDPESDWYLPMAESGIEATKYITLYDRDTYEAMNEYKDLINQTNANIYKLEVIKKEVDSIVRAARKRRQAEMDKKGIPMIDPSCYDLDPTEEVSGGGVRGGTTGNDPSAGGLNYGPSTGTGTGTSGAGGTTGSGGGATGSDPSSGGNLPQATPNFDIVTKENTTACELSVSGKDKSTGFISSYAWGLKLEGYSGLTASSTSKDFSTVVNTGSQYGNATLTLTLKDSKGMPVSLSKNLTIKKSTLGANCPQ